jgi:phage baseplate assembly protein W
MAQAFSIEDGNLGSRPIVTSRTRNYKDIDLTFNKKTTGDIFKKTEAAAVKQAIKNLLLTNKTEKPFQPYFGGNLNSFLFNLDTEFDEDDIRDTIENAIYNFEPRALVQKVQVNLSSDYNQVRILIEFQVISTKETDTLNVSLTRLR